MTLTEALGSYFNALHGGVSQEMQVELHRFVRWHGASSDVQALTLSGVAEYTGPLGASGGDVRESLSAIRAFLVYLKRQRIIAHKLANAVRIPRAKVVDVSAEGSRGEPVYLTKDGYGALQLELKTLKAKRDPIAEDIRRAAADKDVRENAPLEAAREQKGHLESRIRQLEQRLERAIVVKAGMGFGGSIRLGHQVVLRNEAIGKEVVYLLVHPAEADPSQGKISVASPVGKALLGRAAGELVQVTAPRGDLVYHIVEVRR